VLTLPEPLTMLPGSFVQVATRPAGTLLRRPISVAGSNGTHLRLIIRAVGKGTNWLVSREAGDKLNLLLPCGAERELPLEGRRLLLVGGGIGTPPLFHFAEYYQSKAAEAQLIIGALGGEEVEGYRSAVPANIPLTLVSEDGTVGEQGLVTAPLKRLLAKDSPPTTVIACGPEPMLAAVRQLCAEYNADCLVQLESLMACGTGLCQGCAVPMVAGGYKLVCKDGPLFRAEELVWPLPATPRPLRIEVARSAPAPKESLAISLGSLKLKTPILVASGTAGYGPELQAAGGLEGVGAIITKTVTLEPRTGNPAPRICETPAGMLNSIGLANVGLRQFIEEKLPAARALNLPVIVNIGGSTTEEYVTVAEEIGQQDGVAAVELNVSCPNVDHGGIHFGTDPALLGDLTRRVKAALRGQPLFVKLTPNVIDITIPARAAVENGADGLSLINTLVGMAVDVASSRPIIANRVGGLSGPAIRPVAVRMVDQVRRLFPNVPIIGLGGVEDWHDAAELLIAGANVICLGTANLYNPGVAGEVADGLRRLLTWRGMAGISELTGSLRE
jgi:dihydroorotate dehydrogenase (NAD+) catalytic subunit